MTTEKRSYHRYAIKSSMMRTRVRLEKYVRLQKLRRLIIRGNVGFMFFELLRTTSLTNRDRQALQLTIIKKAAAAGGGGGDGVNCHGKDSDDDDAATGESVPMHLTPNPTTMRRHRNYLDAIFQNLFTCAVFRNTCPSSLSLKLIQMFSRFIEFRPIFVAALPFLAFLATFAANPTVRILPLAEDAQCLTLYNVSGWESHVIPWSVNRIVSSLHHPLLDLLAALPYLAHYILPVLYPVFLYLTNRWAMIGQFYRLLGWTMWFHYVIWLLLPTFPPWAVNQSLVNFDGPKHANFQHSHNSLSSRVETTNVINLTQREGRAFSRVDQYLGWPLFRGLFAGNPVPFASFPSGHVAWPTCVLLTFPPGGPLVSGLYVALVSWATMYSDHHYLVDAVGAILVVVVTQKLIGWLTRPAQLIQSDKHLLLV